MAIDPLPPGQASRSLDDLCPCFKAKVEDLLAAARFEGIKVTVTETLRDQLRQAHYLTVGTSWTARSRHLPQPPNGKALAVDICPTEYLTMKGWNGGGAYWPVLGSMGRTRGLLWGGDWKTVKDRPHFEIKKCQCPQGARV